MSDEAEPQRPPPLSRLQSFSGIEFVPKRAMASFENLVALANYEERLKGAKKIVWRDRGERPVEITDLWECIEHASKGGIRAGSLAFAIRSGINFILLLARMRKVPKSYRFALIRQALFGRESWRFAAMLGVFVSLYKFVLNGLPLVLPDPRSSRLRARPSQSHSASRPRSQLRAEQVRRNDSSGSSDPFSEDDDADVAAHALTQHRSRHARLSMSAQAHQTWVRKRTRRWYSVFAGAFAGALAIMCETKNKRTGIAQQLFVRGLQGSYNAISERRGWHVPHGDVLVFALCCAQIVYGLLVHPETLDRSYYHWLSEAAKVPKQTLRMNNDLVLNHKFNPADLEAVLKLPFLTPANRTVLLGRQAMLSTSPPNFGSPFAPCEAIHPSIDSCAVVPIDRFLAVFKWMIPIYGALHFIPPLLFKRKLFMQDPMKMLLRSGFGTLRSSAFFGMVVVIFQTYFCMKNNTWTRLTLLRESSQKTIATKLARFLPKEALDLLVSRYTIWFGGILIGLSLFIEENHRRSELAMYVLPKALESAWATLRGRGLVFRTGKYGDPMLTAAGMGMVMSIYQNDPHHLSSLVRRILYQFVGPN